MKAEIILKNYRCFPVSSPLRFEIKKGFSPGSGTSFTITLESLLRKLVSPSISILNETEEVEGIVVSDLGVTFYIRNRPEVNGKVG